MPEKEKVKKSAADNERNETRAASLVAQLPPGINALLTVTHFPAEQVTGRCPYLSQIPLNNNEQFFSKCLL